MMKEENLIELKVLSIRSSEKFSILLPAIITREYRKRAFAFFE